MCVPLNNYKRIIFINLELLLNVDDKGTFNEKVKQLCKTLFGNFPKSDSAQSR